MALKKFHIKKDDMVKVLSGNERGKTAKVLYVDLQKERILLEGTNLKKKHVRPSQERQKGGIIDVEHSIAISNVRLVCPKCSKTTTIIHKVLENGKKVRVCKKCSEIIDKE